jgi:tRNA threonylcarbamoyladenosine biosynthesis protein TsaB
MIHIALWKEDEFFEIKKKSRFHSIHIIDTIENTLNEKSLRLKDIDVFAANTGPGSFTGTRVGILTAMGFSKIFEKKLIYISKDEDYVKIPENIDKRQNNNEVTAVYNSLSYFER